MTETVIGGLTLFANIGAIIRAVIFIQLLGGYGRGAEGTVLSSRSRREDWVFTAIFATEAALKITALGLFRYLKDRWNCFDLFVVSLSLIELGLSGNKAFSILRSFRLLRVFKLAKSWPTLNLLINIIGRTLGALGNLCFVLAIIVFIFAVMGMQVFGANYTKDKFEGEEPRWNFIDFLHSFMIVFRVLCGEWIESTWDCIHCCGFHCIPFFLTTMIVGNLVVLNLFLALLLSSFGAQKLQSSNNGGGDEAPNKLMEAIDRIRRWSAFAKSRCCPLSPSRRTLVNTSADYPLLDDSHSLPDLEENVFNVVVSLDHIDSGKVTTLTKVVDTAGQPQSLDNVYSSEAVVSAALDAHGPTAAVDAPPPPPTLPPAPSSTTAVTVVYVPYPGDCCPKSCRCKYWCWDAFLRTKLGDKWWTYRCYCKRLVDHRYFETFIIFMIMTSSISLAMENKDIEHDENLKGVLKSLDKVYSMIFVLEMVLKMAAYGPKKYLSDAWCWLDFMIVAISLVSLGAEGAGLGNMGAFRALRTFRALRPLRAVSRWEGMKVVVNALVQAIPSILNVLLVCLVFWLVFSIMGVTLFSGRFYSCEDSEQRLINASLVPDKQACDNLKHLNYSWNNPIVNFDSVPAAYLALFQVATFKGWMDIMKHAIDSTEVNKQPTRENRAYMYMYFVFFIIFGSFFTLNLFIGVIIDNFKMQKRKAGGSIDMLMTEDQKKYYNAMKKLGSKQPRKPIPKPKLVTNKRFEAGVMIVILLNMVAMALEYDKMPKTLKDSLDYVNLMFVSVFTMECFMKLLALRLHYFKEPWNVFDFVIVVVSILVQILMRFRKDDTNDMPFSPTLLRVIRVFRVGRVLRLVKSAKGIRTLLFSLAVSLPALFNIGLLLFLIMFIYAVFGMQFFMHIKHSAGIDEMFNFETFGQGMVLLFQMATSAGWDGVLAGLLISPPDCNNTFVSESMPHGDCGSGGLAIAYLVTYLVISFLVIINMYIAVILENFSQATEDVQKGVTQEDFDMYYEVWQMYDETGSQFLALSRLSEFVNTLEEPLRLPAPNYCKLITLDIPIYEGDVVHCLDVLDALTQNYLGMTRDVTGELGDLNKGPERTRYRLATSTMLRRREEFCARIIQTAWRQCVLEGREKRRVEAEATAAMTVDQSPVSVSESSTPLRTGNVVLAPLDSISEKSAASSTESAGQQRNTDTPRDEPPTSTTV